MDNHLFRGGKWVIDLNDTDCNRHLADAGFNQDTLLIMKYFLFFLFVESSELRTNEFSERHGEIKDVSIAVMSQKFSAAARHLSAVIEGMVKETLINDMCLIDSTPYPKWTGPFHKYPEPKNFYQLLEGALHDPRSRIGRVIDYPPSEEIFHVGEMIRNPLAHGSVSAGSLNDYKALLFLPILLYHDLVNPHGFPGNHKYQKWIERKCIDLRLSGETPTKDAIVHLATEAGLDADDIRANLPPNI